MSQRKAVTGLKTRAYAYGSRPEKVRILIKLLELKG